MIVLYRESKENQQLVCQFPHRGPFDQFWLSEALLGQCPDKKTTKRGLGQLDR